MLKLTKVGRDVSARCGTEEGTSASEIRDLRRRCNELEEKLNKSETDYLNLFHNAVGGIYRSTPEGRFNAVNPAMARMFGYDSPEDVMKSVTDIAQQFYVIPAVRDQYKELLERKNIAHNLEFQAYRKDRSIIWVSFSTRVVRSEAGGVIFYEGFIEDITERKKIEERLRFSLEELARSNSELTKFASIASHDLSEPIRIISSYCKLLSDRYGNRLDQDGRDLVAAFVERALHRSQ